MSFSVVEVGRSRVVDVVSFSVVEVGRSRVVDVVSFSVVEVGRSRVVDVVSFSVVEVGRSRVVEVVSFSVVEVGSSRVVDVFSRSVVEVGSSLVDVACGSAAGLCSGSWAAWAAKPIATRAQPTPPASIHRSHVRERTPNPQVPRGQSHPTSTATLRYDIAGAHFSARLHPSCRFGRKGEGLSLMSEIMTLSVTLRFLPPL